ncbi:hypothetical protein Gpo141_00006613 [Globisporangium polare]
MSSVRSGSYPRKYSQMPSGPTGLVVQGDYGTERLVFTDQQLCDDLIATIPKLHDAVRRDMRGEQWKPTSTSEGVEKYELVPVAAGNDGDDDLDLIHAVVAKTELKCHINEVLNVLINQDSEAYGATMKALNGKKFSQGDVLFQQRCKLVPEASAASSKTGSRFSVSSRGGNGADPAADDQANAQSGLIAVKLATIKPKFSFMFSRKFKRTQKLCLATFTHKYPSKDRAVHIIKTLPKPVHDQIVASENRSALRRELDHLSVGFDIQFFPKPGGGSIDQTTRVLAHGYASTTSPESFGNLGQKRIPRYNAAELAKRREAIMNPEAKHVLNMLTDSLAQFERVIRRRRIGLQSFIYFPEGYDDPNLLKSCAICVKPFKFYRRDFFCQLCGQMSCGECSQLYEVEARVGEIRQNRVCLTCVVRVDKCVFDDEDIVEALGPVVVDNDDREWYDDDRFHFDLDDRSETVSVTSSDRSSMDNMTDQLYSDDPTQWSIALETLGRLVSPTAKHEYTYLDPDLQAQSNTLKRKKSKSKTKQKPKTLEQKVRSDVENHLSYSLRVNKDKYKPKELSHASKMRDNKLEFDPTRTMFPDQPLAPVIDAQKDEKRVEYIKQAKLLDPEMDLSALSMIAQVAAKRMNCPVGYISVIDDQAFHALATFPKMKLPPMNKDEVICAHTLYEEKPLIVNPSRDMRFRNVPMAKMSETKFYAGFPIRAPDGAVFATLCTTDRVAHNHITAKEYATMESLAQLASDLVAQKAGY